MEPPAPNPEQLRFRVEIKTSKAWERFGGDFSTWAEALAFFCGLQVEDGIRLTVVPKGDA